MCYNPSIYLFPGKDLPFQVWSVRIWTKYPQKCVEYNSIAQDYGKIRNASPKFWQSVSSKQPEKPHERKIGPALQERLLFTILCIVTSTRIAYSHRLSEINKMNNSKLSNRSKSQFTILKKTKETVKDLDSVSSAQIASNSKLQACLRLPFSTYPSSSKETGMTAMWVNTCAKHCTRKRLSRRSNAFP
jgi:hypothetical protein